MARRSRSEAAKACQTRDEPDTAVVDLSASGWNTLYAPASMSAARQQQLAQAVRHAMADPALQAKFEAAEMVPVSSSSAETAAMLQAYARQWAPVVKNSGFKP